MRRYVKFIPLLLLTALLFTGCGLRTVDQLYCLPRRSQVHNELQPVIDEAMDGLAHCVPMYGENRQTVQPADLDGDGIDEYLVFAKDNSEKPLKILIFSQLASGYVLMDTIEGYGMGFDFVEYAQLDDRPGLEIVVGRQVSDQAVRAVSVYRFTNGIARQLLSTGYSRLAVCDLDRDQQSELFLLVNSTAEDGNGHVMLYSYQNDEMVCSQEQTVSTPAAGFSRFTEGALSDGRQAMFVTCETENKTLVTDVFILEQEQLTAVKKGILTQALKEYRVYPTDVDGDGRPEIARIIPVSATPGSKKQSFLQWYSLDSQGNETVKLHTYHNYAEGWFAVIAQEHLSAIYVEQTDGGTVFSLQKNGDRTVMVTVLALTDADRETEAKQENRWILYKGNTVIYVADVTPAAEQAGITLESLKEIFSPIRAELTTEED